MVNSDNCCGCGACSNICGKNAITIQEDENGFIVPAIDTDKCVECHACESVCPRINNPINFHQQQSFYAAYHNSVEVRNSSSSGGMFTAISDYVLDHNGAVVGVIQNPDLTLTMGIAITKEQRDQFKKSKYVQCRTNDIYLDIRDRLHKGQLVLFTGVPCQVSALRLFLKREYENLICVDILCHGIPSESVFLDYIKYKEKKANHKIVKYNFRDRHSSLGWKKTVFSAKYEDGSVEKIDGRFDYYYGLFYRNVAHRSSCFTCMHKTKERVGDITLGDFWGVDDLIPGIDTYNGVSLLIVNSNKGSNILNAIKNTITCVPCDISAKIPQTMTENNPPYKFRDSFFRMRKKNGFAYACFFHVFLFRLAMKMHLIKKNYR